MAQTIQRSSVDQALNNLTDGMLGDLRKIRGSINSAWGQLEEARKNAKKNRDALIDTADKNRKKKRDAAQAEYVRKAKGTEGVSYEAYQQELTGIDEDYDAEREHAVGLFNKECEEAENKFRNRTAEHIEQFSKGINTTLDNFKSAHP